MGSRQPMREIPGALRATLAKAHAEFGAVTRKIRWGEGPVYVCGVGDCAALGVAAAYAFEMFLGWPVVARPVEVFDSYGLALLHPRSLLLMISAGGTWPEAQALALSAQERGCTLVALANTPASPLVSLADHVFLVGSEGDTESPSVTVGMHAALNFLAFETMRALKKPKPHWESLAKDFAQLPDKLEWVFTQLSEPVRSMAGELLPFPHLRVVGGGFCHYPAMRAARRMQFLAGLPAEALEASEFWSGLAHFAQRDAAVFLVSTSNSKIKKVLHRSAAQARSNGARVLSLTDSNDRDLADASDLGILVPALLEAPSSTLSLFMLEWLAMEASQAAKAGS